MDNRQIVSLIIFIDQSLSLFVSKDCVKNHTSITPIKMLVRIIYTNLDQYSHVFKIIVAGTITLLNK